MQFRKHLEVTRLQLHKCRSFSNFGPKGDGFRRRLFLSSRPWHRNLLAEAPPAHCLRKFAKQKKRLESTWCMIMIDHDWPWLIMIDHVRVSNVSNDYLMYYQICQGFSETTSTHRAAVQPRGRVNCDFLHQLNKVQSLSRPLPWSESTMYWTG